jgi:hypothetical protein
MKEYEASGLVGVSAARADMCRQTASKYVRVGKLPSELKEERRWRTRADAFAAVWEDLAARLAKAPELEAKTLLEYLCRERPGQFHAGQLRTLQRRVRRWRVMRGPAREVFFEQVHAPGRRLSLDFTRMNELEVTLGGEPFAHLLCHCVLAYSNWEWGTILTGGESLAALRSGVQATLFRLGMVPQELWTDNSTAATHRPGREVAGPGRAFNAQYLEMCSHFGLTARRTGVSEPNENGDVESLHGVLKGRLEQALLLRGSRDFADVEQYRLFVEEVMDRANDARRPRLDEELAVMRPLSCSRLAEFRDLEVTVRQWSTIRVDRSTYSVASRLIGQKVTARLYADRIEVLYGGEVQERIERLAGRGEARIAYRHVIHSLVRKPGAFRDWRHREALFPSLVFRQAYDRLCAACPARTADLEYLQILKLAADTLESDVEAVLARLGAAGTVPRLRTVEEFLPGRAPLAVPCVTIPVPDLAAYDLLLGGACSHG